jgi:hypothetical protein
MIFNLEERYCKDGVSKTYFLGPTGSYFYKYTDIKVKLRKSLIEGVET